MDLEGHICISGCVHGLRTPTLVGGLHQGFDRVMLGRVWCFAWLLLSRDSIYVKVRLGILPRKLSPSQIHSTCLRCAPLENSLHVQLCHFVVADFELCVDELCHIL